MQPTNLSGRSVSRPVWRCGEVEVATACSWCRRNGGTVGGDAAPRRRPAICLGWFPPSPAERRAAAISEVGVAVRNLVQHGTSVIH
jgi:hypothetical protein